MTVPSSPAPADQYRTSRRCRWFHTGHGEGPVAPLQGTLPEPQLVAGPLAGAVDREPRRLVGCHVENEHQGTGLDGVGEAEQVAGDPQLLERPPDVRVAEPQQLGGHLAGLHEVPDRGRALHAIILAAQLPGVDPARPELSGRRRACRQRRDSVLRRRGLTGCACCCALRQDAPPVKRQDGKRSCPRATS